MRESLELWPEFKFLLDCGFLVVEISDSPSALLARATLKGPMFFIRLDADRLDRMIDIGPSLEEFYCLEFAFELLQPDQKFDALDMAKMAAFAQANWQKLEDFCRQPNWTVKLKAKEDARAAEIMKRFS